MANKQTTSKSPSTKAPRKKKPARPDRRCDFPHSPECGPIEAFSGPKKGTGAMRQAKNQLVDMTAAGNELAYSCLTFSQASTNQLAACSMSSCEVYQPTLNRIVERTAMVDNPIAVSVALGL